MTATAARYARHVDPQFVKLLGVLGYGRVFTRAEGVHVRDEQGRRYLDLLAGFGSANIGHNHPRLIARLHGFLDEHALNLSHTGPSAYAARLAEALATLAGPPLEMALFATGGAEAVEAAIKAARAATRRTRIVFCERAYHGLSFGTLSVSASTRMRTPFEPLLPDCVAVPFGDVDALARVLGANDVAVFLVEPVQIEGGVHFAPEGYLHAARELCTKHGTLLAFDEVQTGYGRTGSTFAFQPEDATPDLLILGKSAGGSIVSIGITLTTRSVQKKAYGSMRRFDLHGSTFAGNAFACAAALETIAILRDEQLDSRSHERGAQMLAGLRARLHSHPLVADVRGRGLLIGIELRAPVATTLLGQWLALALLEAGLIVQPASQAWNVLRIEPPLTIDAAQVAEAVEMIGTVFDNADSVLPILGKSGRRIVEQLLARGRFR